jgi:formylglycine-generating enzyme required for sulfatase activity
VSFGAAKGEYVNDHDGSILVYVRAGAIGENDVRYSVGLTDEKPRRFTLASRVPAFLIGKHEVTTEQFDRFKRQSGYKCTNETTANPGGFVITGISPSQPWSESGDTWTPDNARSFADPQGPRPGPDDPVTCVSFFDADAYAHWAECELPTHDQWIVAALHDPEARKLRRFPWGDEPPNAAQRPPANLRDVSLLKLLLPGMTWTGYDDGFPFRAPVGSFPGDRSPCDALDMAGNVSEWVWADPAREESNQTGYAGGQWCTPPEHLLMTKLVDLPAHVATSDVGFRISRRLDR